MKTIKILTIALACTAFGANAMAQSTSTANRTEVKKDGWDQKKMRALFKSGVVPADFPKYNDSLTKEENQRQVLKWMQVPANQKLLSQKGLDKYKKLSSM